MPEKEWTCCQESGQTGKNFPLPCPLHKLSPKSGVAQIKVDPSTSKDPSSASNYLIKEKKFLTGAPEEFEF